MVKIEEIWKDISGLEGKYQVSNLGRVRSLPRYVQSKHRSSFIVKGRIRVPYLGTDDYLRITLPNKKSSIHRLVASAFLGESNLQVDHINGNRLDNRLENLRYCSNRDNCTFATKKINKYTGVSSTGKKWRARTMFNGENVHLGSFNTQEEAHKKYLEVMRNIKLYGALK